MKYLGFTLLAALILSACAGKKLSQDQTFLQTPDEGKSRIYFYSILPESYTHESVFLSVLLSAHRQKEQCPLDAHIRYYEAEFGSQANRHYHVDTLLELDEAHFPLSLFSTRQYYGEPAFQHSIDRHKVRFLAYDSIAGKTRFQVYFPNAAALSSSTVAESFGIHGCSPADNATLKFEVYSDYTVRQRSAFTFQTLDSTDILFSRRKKETFFWLNYLYENTSQTLFFSVDLEQHIEMHLNTLGAMVRVRALPSYPTVKSISTQAIYNVTLDFDDKEFSIVPLTLPDDPRDLKREQFWVGAVELKCVNADAPVRVGNLFVL